jgi:hypothetical protein
MAIPQGPNVSILVGISMSQQRGSRVVDPCGQPCEYDVGRGGLGSGVLGQSFEPYPTSRKESSEIIYLE